MILCRASTECRPRAGWWLWALTRAPHLLSSAQQPRRARAPFSSSQARSLRLGVLSAPRVGASRLLSDLGRNSAFPGTHFLLLPLA